MNPANFMSDPEAEELFAKLDYLLREGVHIQENRKQEAYFRFIVKNTESLEAYYRQFFNLHLTRAGDAEGQYYFLEFNNQARGPIDADHRDFLRPEHVIVGFLLFRLAISEGRVELDTIEKFQRILRAECEDIRPHLNRIFTKLRTTGSNQTTDERIDAAVEEAVRAFEKLGWLLTSDDGTFEIQSSFFRLQNLYHDYINDVDNLIRSHAAKESKTP